MRRDPFAWRRVATVAPRPDPLAELLHGFVAIYAMKTLVENASRINETFERILAPLRVLL
jgi:hypothetical protein